jgi:protein tyrosine phosphatase
LTGYAVAVSCSASIGRTGTVLACILISIGYPFKMRTLKKYRGHVDKSPLGKLMINIKQLLNMPRG